MIEREESSHKGENGKVTVIGGSRDYTGAPVISAMAAYRTGADLVKLLVPEMNRHIAASHSPNLIVRTYQGESFSWDSGDKARELVEWCDSVVVGPGSGDADYSFLEGELQGKAVIDAEAIEQLSAEPDSILTPHRGELDYLDRKPEEYVDETGNILAIKGHIDKVYSPEGNRDIARGTPAMTVGGTGDMLTGIIASLKAQGMEDFEATTNGLRIAGSAGELADEKYGNGALATDMIEEIPRAVDHVL
jgi:NAD(P)H-hydrate epimerase